MKKVFVLFLLAISLLSNAENSYEAEAKKMANRYYSSLQKIVKAPLDAAQVEVDLMKMCGVDVNGHTTALSMLIANDIKPIFQSNNDKSDISFAKYVGFFRKYAESQHFDFSYEIVAWNQIEGGPSNGSGLKNIEPQFVEVVARKVFTIGNKSTSVEEIMDIVFVGNSASLVRISNMYGTHETTGDLFMEALKKYRQMKYKEAFGLFEKVLQKYPNHQNASYYLGIMLYKNQGCKDKYPTRKQRDEQAIAYWRLSPLGRNAICYYTDGRDCD